MVLAISAHWHDSVLAHESFGEEEREAIVADIAFDLDELRDELDRAKTLRLERGPLLFVACDIAPALLREPAFLDRLEYRWINSLLIVFFLHSIAVTAFVGAPLVGGPLPYPRAMHRGKIAQVALTPARPRPAVGPIAPAPGKIAGKKRGSPAANPKSLIEGLFGSGDARRSIAGSGGLGSSLQTALGGVRGVAIGDAGGGGSRGGHALGGGGLRSLGIGELARRPAGYGEGLGSMQIGKSVTEIQPKLGPPVIKGSLEKEVIRRVINSHIAQIRYCYELELVRDPGAFGKISTRFVIGSEGKVIEVEAKESFSKDRQLSDCIAEKIRGWIFPKPKGGGVVVVHYPFIVHFAG